MTELQRSRAERRAAVILAGKEIRKLNFGRAGTCDGQTVGDRGIDAG